MSALYCQALFNFTALVRMGLADNEIEALSPNIGNLIELEELDISRNSERSDDA